MSFEEQINADYITAYKTKNNELVSVLRLLRTAIKNAAIAKKEPLNDEEIVRILKKEVKQRQESIPEYEKGGRNDLALKEQNEISLIQKYLPEEMDENTVREIVVNTIAKLGHTHPNQIGEAIGTIMAETKGNANGSLVAKIVREILSR